MPSFKPTAIWEADPHTLAKIEIVRRYLYLWFTILSSNPANKTLVCIDGFAGPGEYTNNDSGSPIAALDAAVRAVSAARGRMNRTRLEFLFIEKNPKFAAHLRTKIASRGLPPTFAVEVREGEFASHANQFLQAKGSAIPATFAFVDPFGATKVPFGVITAILRHRSCELLFNLDSDGVVRLLNTTNPKNEENLTLLFGDQSWKSLDPKKPMRQLSTDVLNMYKQRLRTLPGVRYVFPFAMNTRDGELNYHLVFASQHFLGLEKMKEAMRAVDQSGAYSFSDDFSSQALLPFDFSAPADWAEKMYAVLGNQWRSYDEFRDFALNETPFIHPKAMFEHLKALGRVKVEWRGEPPRRGFPEEKISKLILLPP
jgi:three-Cys-motif partner protein